MNFAYICKLPWVLASILFCVSALGKTFSVKSPDGNLEAVVEDGGNLKFSVNAYGKNILSDCEIGVKTDIAHFGKDASALASETSHENSVIENVIGIRSKINDSYNLLKVKFEGYSLIVRAYDEGVAYRFAIDRGRGKMTVFDETLSLNLQGTDKIIAHIVGADRSSYEELYTRGAVADLEKSHSATLPFIFEKDGMKIAVLESDVWGYPGMRLAYGGEAIKSYFAKYPKSFGSDGPLVTVAETEDFIARTSSSRELPWRIFVVSRADRELAENDTVLKLARPAVSDMPWVEPGLCVWDWWGGRNLEGVDFETGVNDATYKYMIDFASENEIPYMLIDAGWLDTGGVEDSQAVLRSKTNINVSEIIEYAAERDVKIILWLLARNLGENAEKSLDILKRWGAAGVKVDFIDRDDQLATEFYENIAKLAAERQLIVDFHGCSIPTGLQRTYPNVLNFEAVRGNEYNKFNDSIEPPHNVDLVFTRMLQGPMDYTPGAMNNAGKDEFRVVGRAPMAKGTRAHQIAMYVLYNSPLQMLCDSVTQYERDTKLLGFLQTMPTAWDETKALDGKIGEFVVVARKKSDTWYIGGMNNWDGREVEIDLSFLDPKLPYKAEILRDGPNTPKLYRDYKIDVKKVQNGEKLKIKMAPGGGFAVKLRPKKFDIFGIEIF